MLVRCFTIVIGLFATIFASTPSNLTVEEISAQLGIPLRDNADELQPPATAGGGAGAGELPPFTDIPPFPTIRLSSTSPSVRTTSSADHRRTTTQLVDAETRAKSATINEPILVDGDTKSAATTRGAVGIVASERPPFNYRAGDGGPRETIDDNATGNADDSATTMPSDDQMETQPPSVGSVDNEAKTADEASTPSSLRDDARDTSSTRATRLPPLSTSFNDPFAVGQPAPRLPLGHQLPFPFGGGDDATTRAPLLANLRPNCLTYAVRTS